MPQLTTSNYLVLLMAGMLVWVSVNVLIAIVRLNRTYELTPNRFIYPGNCKPERCQDLVGFVGFITPRLAAFGVLGLLLAVWIWSMRNLAKQWGQRYSGEDFFLGLIPNMISASCISGART